MIVSSNRSKIPKQYGFVLQTNQIENLMADINIPIHLGYSGAWITRCASGRIFHAQYRFPNCFHDYTYLDISVGFLLKGEIFSARKELSEVTLPEFVIWVKKIMALPNDSTYFNKTPYFQVNFHNKLLTIVKS